MKQKEYCETKCKFYKPIASGRCQYLKKADKPQKLFGVTIVREGAFYCNHPKLRG